MRKKSPTLTPQELEIMKVVWASGDATVREVHDQLRRRRDIAKTTVQTMMNVLETKGHLARTPSPEGQVYTPSRPQHQVVRGMVREFVTRVFDGSARPLLTHLIKDSSLSERERRALQRLLEDEQ